MIILTLSDYYLPGYRAGGPIQSIANLVDRFSPEFHFKVVARDRDFGASDAYSGIRPAAWQPVGKAEVCYLPPGRQGSARLRDLLVSTEYDVLYLNSFFSPRYSIWPLMLRRMGGLPDRPVVLAPRGEFSPGALSLESRKKRVFLAAASALQLHDGVVWQASTQFERADILRHFGHRSAGHSRVMIAPDLPPPVAVEDDDAWTAQKGAKRSGRLKAIFLSRICPMKNLAATIDLLSGVCGAVEFTIAGPVEDAAYWHRCQKSIQRLPANVHVRCMGPIESANVVPLLRQHELLVLPTLGENFGHVILEALLAGLPVLISDRTPWRGLEAAGIGWDLPLERPDLFQAAVQRCVNMTEAEHRAWRVRSRAFAIRHSADDAAVRQNRALFEAALAGRRELHSAA